MRRLPFLGGSTSRLLQRIDVEALLFDSKLTYTAPDLQQFDIPSL